MTDQCFAITVGLKTPIIITARSFLGLDGVLGAMLFARTGDMDRANRDIPLARTGEIWHGSAGFLDSVLAQSLLPSFKRGISIAEEMWAPAYQTGTGRNRNTPIKKRVDIQRDRYATQMDQYPSVAASTLKWFGRGDLAAVRDLLSDLRYVGKKSRQGWGQVQRIDFDETDTDLSIAWEGPDGIAHPMRPVPVDLWQSMGHSADGLLQQDAAVAPPYFCYPPARCVVPSSRTEPWAGLFA